MSACVNAWSHDGGPTTPVAGSVSDYCRAFVEDQKNPLRYYRLADACRRRGDDDGWLRAIRLAFELTHTTQEQLFMRARAKLTLGDWSGWADYNARLFKHSFNRSVFSRELRWKWHEWDGVTDLRDRTLFVLCEQGFGDTIQMLRFLPSVADRARRAVVAVQPELLSWVKSNFEDRLTVMAMSAVTVVAAYAYVRMMSLPALVGALPPFVPLTVPYRSVIAARNCRRQIGVCWAGNPTYANDAARSMPLATLDPLLGNRDVVWHSLYVGNRQEEIRDYPHVRSPCPPLESFLDTAALINSLDAVVTCDTAVCHVAGSLGVPTFLLLPYASHWRWGLDEFTTWYPSVRLFRQPAPGDWKGAVARVEAALAAVVQGPPRQ